MERNIKFIFEMYCLILLFIINTTNNFSKVNSD